MVKKGFLILLAILLVPFVLADSYTYYAESTTYQGAFYGQSGAFPCTQGDCWVHDCAWFSSRINVPEAGYYSVKMSLTRDGNGQYKENIRLEVNSKIDYQLDDGSYTQTEEFGPFYFYKGTNNIKFSSTRYGDFYYIGEEDLCYYGSVHFNKFTLKGCPDTDNDNVCDYYDYCIGENQNNLPPDTACRNWFIDELGCHEFTNKEPGYIIRYIDCDFLDTSCKDYTSTKDVCDSNGNVQYGSCDEYGYEPTGTVCGTSYYESSCYMGTGPGSDVYRKYHNFECDGYGACKEVIDDWEIYQDCTENQECYQHPSGIVECKEIVEENVCPIIDPIDDIIATVGDKIGIFPEITDPDDSEHTLYLSGPFNNALEWQTEEGDEGNYTIRVRASDYKCEDFLDINIEVLPLGEENCVSMGYKCTSAIRGCGHYQEYDYECEGGICCEEIPYCGDGVCFTHSIPGYGEDSETCPEDCNQTEEPEEERACFPEFDKSNSIIDIRYVEVNDLDIYENEDERIAIERGQDLFVKVRFEAEENISEVQIEAYIDIDDIYEEEFNITERTDWFKAVKGNTYTKELILNVPDDLIEDNYRLKIKLYDRDGLLDTCKYYFKVSLPIYELIIKDIKLTPQVVKAGRVMVADVEIKNIGNATIENIKVKISVPELNTMDSEIIEELEPRDSKIVRDLILRIPACTDHADYYVKATADYEYETITKVKLFEVLDGEGCSDIVDSEELKVIPKAENFVQGGDELPYTVIVNNPSDKSRTYILTADGIDVFGEYRFEPSNVLVIPAGKSQVTYLYVKAEPSDIIGAKPVVVTARTDKELKEDVVANIIKGKQECSFCVFWSNLRYSLWYPLLLLLIIIAAFLLILFLLLKRDKDEEEEK